MKFIYLLAIVAFLPIPTAFGQEVITVNSTTPCFLNYSAGWEMWENCGAKEDYLTFSLLGWEWITGGYFSMVIVSIFVMFSYVKYHKMIYPVIVGVIFMPVSYYLFPDVFLTWSILMAFAGIGILIWYVYIKQTKEY